jgi:alpha-amylase
VRRTAAGTVLVAVLVAACSDGGDDTPTADTPVANTPAATDAPEVNSPATTEPDDAPPTTAPLDQSAGPIAAPVRSTATERPIYFVMPDRFENGDPTNDTGGLEGDALVHGFDPTRRGFHHGGDLVGLRERLPYLHDLGMRALWITPPFTNRFVQGNGTLEGSSSSYHGYWQIDWDRIDPHLGTEDDMHALIDAAHDLGMHVYFDIVANHTGDVITYAEGSTVYYSQTARPYRDADGVPFDPAEYAGGDTFPELDPAVSFAYTPTFRDPADATAKSPAWLNDVTLYHNRGDSSFSGESDTFGDFFGLDDLFTEHPRVVAGMIEMYGDIIERYDIDGVRVDTMKHVNIEFWEAFAPAIRERAAALGKPDFAMFGEVFNTDPIVQSSFTNVGVVSTLDFIFDNALQQYVTGGGADVLVEAFDDDDWFTDADNNASMQVTFFGNHDKGRMGHLVDSARPGADDAELLARLQLANDLLFLVRGQPVVYYGDEQGFTGTGGDQLARQDMFPSLTPEYVDDDSIGTDATPADDNFDPDHPLYRHIASLAELRAEHPAFSTGAHVVHDTDGPVFAFSRIDRDERVEYVVLTNSNASLAVPARFPVLSPDTAFTALRGDVPADLRSDPTGELFVEVPPLGTIVLRADAPLAPPAEPPTIRLVRPDAGIEIPTARYRIEAELGDRRYAEVTFAVAIDGAEPVVIGVDDAAPYRVYWNNAALPAGTAVDVIATVSDGSGALRSDVVSVTLGER